MLSAIIKNGTEKMINTRKLKMNEDTKFDPEKNVKIWIR